MNLKNRVIIFSVFRPENRGKNYRYHSNTINSLRELGAVELEGHYEGKLELSIMLPYTPELLERVTFIAHLFNQDSILVTNGDGTATIQDLKADKEFSIGELKAMPKSQAETLEYYSYNPATDQYFGVA